VYKVLAALPLAWVLAAPAKAAGPDQWYGTTTCDDVTPAGRKAGVRWSVEVKPSMREGKYAGTIKIAGTNVEQTVTFAAYPIAPCTSQPCPTQDLNVLAVYPLSAHGQGPVSTEVNDFAPALFTLTRDADRITFAPGLASNLSCRHGATVETRCGKLGAAAHTLVLEDQSAMGLEFTAVVNERLFGKRVCVTGTLGMPRGNAGFERVDRVEAENRPATRFQHPAHINR
jgi:hypothetical protein